MRFDSLEAFVAFAETLNFTRAAEQLHLSQPALHVKIRKLGEDLGVELYRREGRSLVLTDSGRRVEAFARSLADQVADFRRELREERERAPVVVSAGRATHLHLLAAPLREWLRTSGRGVQLRAETREETVRALRSGRAHLGVAPLDPPPPTLVARPIVTVPTVLIVARDHPLGRRKRIRLEELDGHRLILPPADRPHHARVMAALADAGARVEVAIEAGGWELMAHSASLGLGAAPVNGICPVPDGAVSLAVTGLPSITYHALLPRGRPVADDVRALFEYLVAGGRGRRGV